MQSEQFDLIISSPLKRALQTAEIINASRNIPIITDERISERDFGEFEGKGRGDFDFYEFWSYKESKRYISAENIEDFFNRIYAFLNEIREKYEDKKVLLVTHAGVSIAIKCYFSKNPNMDELLSMAIDNCEVIKFENV